MKKMVVKAMFREHGNQTSKFDPVSRLVFELSKLPSIGEKSATRLAYHILKQDASYARALADAIVAAKHQIGLCSSCHTFTDISPCRVCSDDKRDTTVICVVERPSDIYPIERTGVHKGLYHVLHGVLSPLDGVGPDDLKISELISRVKADNGSTINEVILATNPSVEGEATALYLSKLIAPFGVKSTKLASGIPSGGQLEFSDNQTIAMAIENRIRLS
jgi:recombination protein RecR